IKIVRHNPYSIYYPWAGFGGCKVLSVNSVKSQRVGSALDSLVKAIFAISYADGWLICCGNATSIDT
ncbi:MAG: hypothetical protein RSB48_06075, partial [Akkermansia sp.]